MKKNKTILIISHYFPPIKNVQSKINLSTYLTFIRWGIKPLVLTANPEPYEKDLSFDKFLKNIERYYYDGYIKTSFIDKIRGFLSIPKQKNIFGGFWKEIYNKAERIILQEKIDIIYSISAPGDAHFAAMKLKEKYDFFWIAEFQDPWIKNITFDSWARENMQFLYRKFLNRKIYNCLLSILSKADIVLTESKGHADLLKEIFDKKIDTFKIKTCYLGVDPELLKISTPFILNELLEPLSRKIIIGFVGNVYFGYEETVKNFLEFFSKLDKKKFVFLSVGCPFINSIVNEKNINNAICIESVPYSKAISIIKQLDWGVVIPSSSININSKLFDYLGCGVPALVWGKNDDEMSVLVDNNKWGINIDREHYNRIYDLEIKKDTKLILQNNIYRHDCLASIKRFLFG